MNSYKYLMIGGGMTADAAVQGIREIDPDGSIGLIGKETDPPYNRPPLSKGLWKGKPLDSIWRNTEGRHATLHLGRRIVSLNADEHLAQDDQGNEFHGEKILLATGGTPRRLSFGGEDILYYRTLDDYKTLRSWTQKGARIGVIGGGFIGSEIAAALASNHEQVVMVLHEPAIGARIYPADLANFVTDYYRKKGVEVCTGLKIQGIERRDNRFFIHGEEGQILEVDHIVAGIGLLPNTELAQAAGIETAGSEIGGGIQVDIHLRTSQPDIYAAGDVASIYNPFLNRQLRYEHEDNANTMGRIAGLNMAGQATSYEHLSFFYSDLFDLGYEAVGDLDPRLETYADWREPFYKGIIYYLRDKKVCGVLLWNTWDQVETARKLIGDGHPLEISELKGLPPKS